MGAAVVDVGFEVEIDGTLQLDSVSTDDVSSASTHWNLLMNASNQVKKAKNFVPKGAIMMWAGTTAPSGWRLCTGGSAVNGVTIPNLQGKFIVGRDADDSDYDNIGDTGGVETNTISINNLPTGHYIGRAGDGHPDSPQDRTSVGHVNSYPRNTIEGGGQSLNNRPPYYTLAYIIYVGIS